MNKLSTREIVLFVVGLLVVITLLYFYFKKDDVSWYESYRHEKEQPYDFQLFETLTKILDKNNSVETIEVPFSIFQKNLRKSIHKTNNIFIHNGAYSTLDFENTDSLLSFAAMGNKAYFFNNNTNDIRKIIGSLNGITKKFVEDYNEETNTDYDIPLPDNAYEETEDTSIIAENVPLESDSSTNDNNLYDSIVTVDEETLETSTDSVVTESLEYSYEESNNPSNNDDTLYYTNTISYTKTFEDSCVNFSFNGLNFKPKSSFKFCFINDFKNTNRSFDYFSDSTLNIKHTGQKFDKMERIGFVKNKPMFVRYTVGKGEINICLEPILITNYFLSKKEGYEFLNAVFANKIENQFFQNKYVNYNDYNQENNRSYSAFTYITSQEALRWAFYLTLALLLLFFLFFSKRRQNIIPVYNLKENSTIEYAETISRLYQSKKSQAEITEIMSKNFQKFVLHKYGLRQRPNDESFVPKLSKLSGITAEEIETILKMTQKYITFKSEVSTQTLNTYYNKISNFYKNCK